MAGETTGQDSADHLRSHRKEPSTRPGTERPGQRPTRRDIPTTVRCRCDADGIVVWVPEDQLDQFPGDAHQG